MKIMFSLFFIACLISAIFSSTDSYKIQFKGDLKFYGCTTDLANNDIYGFQFSATTSGFTKDQTFKVLLEDPSYMFAQCQVPTSEEGVSATIVCPIYAQYFPLLEPKIIKIPAELTIFDNENPIEVEGWKEAATFEMKECFPKFSYEFNQGENVAFSVAELEDGTKILTSTGSFSPLVENKQLTSGDQYLINPLVFVDSGYDFIECNIIPFNEVNGGEDQISCKVKGTKKVVFFPTITTIDLLENSPELIKLNIYKEVSLSKETSYGSFVKYSSLLLLSLFLL